MTKTELEDDFDRCFDKNTSPTGGGYEADWTDRNGLWDDFRPAVESFAKQEAIEYGEFLIKGHWKSNEQTYKIFIQSKETINQHLYKRLHNS